jgi:hypothetical protein
MKHKVAIEAPGPLFFQVEGISTKPAFEGDFENMDDCAAILMSKL